MKVFDIIYAAEQEEQRVLSAGENRMHSTLESYCSLKHLKLQTRFARKICSPPVAKITFREDVQTFSGPFSEKYPITID